MKYNDEKVKSVGELIDHLKHHLEDYGGPVWFRGQSVIAWHLEPRLMRMNPPPSESHLLNRFKQNASLLVQHQPANDFGWLFLMQHYRIPTRLLDWTESPLVGLYFSITSHETEAGALWVLLPTELNKKSNFKPEFEFEIPSFEDEHLQNYLPDTIAREHKSKLFPIAAIAPRNSARMQAQQGVFTISHRENIYIEGVGERGSEKDHIWRYVIPPDTKSSLQKELRLLGYNKFMLFPELESLSENF